MERKTVSAVSAEAQAIRVRYAAVAYDTQYIQTTLLPQLASSMFQVEEVSCESITTEVSHSAGPFVYHFIQHAIFSSTGYVNEYTNIYTQHVIKQQAVGAGRTGPEAPRRPTRFGPVRRLMFPGRLAATDLEADVSGGGVSCLFITIEICDLYEHPFGQTREGHAQLLIQWRRYLY